ncbi:alpha/beta fold hydrolase [Paraburkholderia diazotrophica]|uniref:TAP-like protein n=3 Tax=Paraburkholderia TaxID=1822464 RepID=A0A1H7EL53_9BURK|nr:alpha/beta hydrolase [Paraburkholderia diazotrophica]AFT89968.1 TAP domain-containing protein [Paraburkholderia phenoliruptrix BR3459a]CAB4052434.1 Tripeptidyl aminopeptidase [Paraburkholderia phenoliruptrix]SEK11425.1 TAP-like protein [Paraburkholderia diazotrophica]
MIDRIAKVLKTARHIGIFGISLIAVGFYGCGGSDGSSRADATPASGDSGVDAALAPYYKQAISWHACSSDTFQDLDSDLLNQLSSRAGCATVKVPLDYDDVSKGSAGIGVLRVNAGKPASRLGAIWMNPGGPGESGLNMPLGVSKLWLLGNSANPVGQKLLQLSDAYDLIGFDPRGVGSSIQLVCNSNATRRFIPFTDRSAAANSAQMIDGREVASACGGTPLTSYINTEYTARDMEVIRVTLGYDKLNYYGTSYGTALGGRYASLFPDRTGRMILDSVVDITLPLAETSPAQAPAFQKILDEIVAPYVAARNDVLGLGSNADDVKKIARSGPAWLTSWLGETMSRSLYAQWQIDDVVADLAVAKGINKVLTANPMISSDALQREIALLHFFPQESEDAEATAQKKAKDAVSTYAAAVSGTTQSVHLDGTDGTYWSVVCNDGALIHPSEKYWTDLGNALAQSAPLIGGMYSDLPCLYWPFSARKPPSFVRAATLSFLLLQDENDGPTPLSGARATAAVLKNSRLVVQSTTYDHGVAFTRSECVSGYMADYLLQGTLPNEGTMCAGSGLSTSTSTTTINSKRAVGARAEEYRTDMYTDDVEAEKTLQKLRKMIR